MSSADRRAAACADDGRTVLPFLTVPDDDEPRPRLGFDKLEELEERAPIQAPVPDPTRVSSAGVEPDWSICKGVDCAAMPRLCSDPVDADDAVRIKPAVEGRAVWWAAAACNTV